MACSTNWKSFSTINAYCCNRLQPNLETLEQIARVLNVEWTGLLVKNPTPKGESENSNKEEQ